MEVESAFLAGAAAKLKFAAGRAIPGRVFKHEDRDDGEALRAAMVERRLYDRERYNKMPRGRGLVVRGYERRWFFGRRLRSVTIASVLAPPENLLDGKSKPIDVATLTRHVRSLVKNDKAPHLIGVCSPGGFEESAWNARLDLPAGVKVVLVAPREGGGWRVSPTEGGMDIRLTQLFDPEDAAQKLGRVKREIVERSGDLLTGGMSAANVSQSMGLPARLVQSAFESMARSDPELRVSQQGGDVLLFRGAATAQEDSSMSLAEWIKSLFSSEGQEAKKINVLSERRASLSTRLDRIYEDIGKLEKKESQLVADGKAATSQVSKRRLATQISHLRKDIARTHTTAAMLSKQANIISTHIHNLELAQTGSVAQLPSSEELTEAAVNAEEILEQLKESDDLVTGLDVGMAELSVSDDEAAILKELEGKEEAPAQPAAGKVSESAKPVSESKQKERGTPQAE
jgi:hypothetical protein